MPDKDNALMTALTALTRAIENLHLIHHFDADEEAEGGAIEDLMDHVLVDHIGDEVEAAKEAVAELAGQPWEIASNEELRRRDGGEPQAR